MCSYSSLIRLKHEFPTCKRRRWNPSTLKRLSPSVFSESPANVLSVSHEDLECVSAVVFSKGNKTLVFEYLRLISLCGQSSKLKFFYSPLALAALLVLCVANGALPSAVLSLVA